MLETDYYQDLSPADQEFLKAFHESEYGGNPDALNYDKGKRRARWRENYKQKLDAMNAVNPNVSEENLYKCESPEDAIIEMLDRYREKWESLLEKHNVIKPRTKKKPPPTTR
jgi:hypothetical protein